NEPFWVVNGDVYCAYDYAIRGPGEGRLAHLVLVPNPEYNPAGDFVLEEGRIVEAPGPRHTFSGISILHPALFAGRSPGRFPLAPLLREAAAAGRVGGELFTGRWTDIGTPERLRAFR